MDEIRTRAIGRTQRRWIVSAGILLGLIGGWLVYANGKPIYTSTASVLVHPVLGNDVNLPTEAVLARSKETAVDAATILGRPGQVPLATVEALPNTLILVIRYDDTTPPAARAGARAFAEAYLARRAAAAKATIAAEQTAVTTKVADLNAQASSVTRRMATLPTTSPEATTLGTMLTSLTAQIVNLTGRSNDLATTTVNPGRIIGEPDLPTRPSRPSAWQYLATGVGAGALLGMAVATGRNRLSRHVRQGTDVPRRAGVALLADLPGGNSGLRPPNSPGGQAFNHLRNEVVAALGPDDRIILITGASPGPASTVVAANLAAAFGRADIDVVLVGANVPEIGTQTLTLSQIFDVADIPGLTDVLTGRASLNRTLQRAARAPRLRIVTPGGTASAAGLLQSEGCGSALDELRQLARYVVLEAPSAAVGADAQSLARVADAAILVVETGRTRHAQVADAARQLRLMGTRLLGAVVLAPVAATPPNSEPLAPPMGNGRNPDDRKPSDRNTDDRKPGVKKSADWPRHLPAGVWLAAPTGRRD